MELISYTDVTLMFVGMFFVSFLGAVVMRSVTFFPRLFKRMGGRKE